MIGWTQFNSAAKVDFLYGNPWQHSHSGAIDCCGNRVAPNP